MESEIEKIMEKIMQNFTEKDRAYMINEKELPKYTTKEIFEEFEKVLRGYIENGGLWDG